MTRSRSVLETSTSFGSRKRADAGTDVHGDAADVVAAEFAFAGVKAGAHLDAQRLHRVTNCHGAADRSLWAVERREEAVAGGVDLAAAETRQL